MHYDEMFIRLKVKDIVQNQNMLLISFLFLPVQEYKVVSLGPNIRVASLMVLFITQFWCQRQNVSLKLVSYVRISDILSIQLSKARSTKSNKCFDSIIVASDTLFLIKCRFCLL